MLISKFDQTWIMDVKLNMHWVMWKVLELIRSWIIVTGLRPSIDSLKIRTRESGSVLLKFKENGNYIGWHECLIDNERGSTNVFKGWNIEAT